MLQRLRKFNKTSKAPAAKKLKTMAEVELDEESERENDDDVLDSDYRGSSKNGSEENVICQSDSDKQINTSLESFKKASEFVEKAKNSEVSSGYSLSTEWIQTLHYRRYCDAYV